MSQITNAMNKIKNLPEFRHPADLLNMSVRPMAQQNMQISGKLEFGTNKYFCPAQQQLVKSLISTRVSYRSASIEDRFTMANQEEQLWKAYLAKRVEELPEENRLNSEQKQYCYNVFTNLKERKEESIRVNKTLKFLHQFGKLSRFTLPLHPLVLLRIIHPHFGYINNYADIKMSFKDYLNFIEEFSAASYIIDEQQNNLHCYELLSYIFWKSYTKKGSMRLEEFCEFLKLFKFNVESENFKEEFSWNLKERAGELDGEMVRFDLWRGIFLERGL